MNRQLLDRMIFHRISSNICHRHIDSLSGMLLIYYKHNEVDLHIHFGLVSTLQTDFRSDLVYIYNRSFQVC